MTGKPMVVAAVMVVVVVVVDIGGQEFNRRERD